MTTGFRGGLTIALRGIDAIGKQAWVEDPGYPPIRHALELVGAGPVPVEVDDEGLKVERGRELAPQAVLAVVTPGQHAPTGVTLSQRRRRALLEWADTTAAWIIEDDYLAELHLAGRSVTALASRDGADRVIHIGSFSKTLSPALGIGFLVAPLPLAQRLVDTASWLGVPPNAALQLALARFLLDGHYLRHLRRMRRLYRQRRRSLLETLARLGVDAAVPAGLSVLLPLGRDIDDRRLVGQARAVDLSPAPLSPWFATASRARSGLLLGIANVLERTIERDCNRLLALMGGPESAREKAARSN